MKRPFGVYVIALMLVLNGLAVGLSVLLEDQFDLDRSLNPAETLKFSIGFPTIFIAFALLMLWRWAWVTTMLLTGLNLATGLYLYLDGNPNYISMVINIFIVFYLNQREVQRAFD